MKQATQDLRNEHEAILFVLKIMRKMAESDVYEDAAMLRWYGEIVDFLRIFGDRCHHGKEELFLFPELEKKGVQRENGPVGVMLSEHTQARGLIAGMAEAVEQKDRKAFEENALSYAELMEAHIDKENNILFGFADRLFSGAEQVGLFESFERHEEQVVGSGVHEQLHAKIHAWAEAFDVTH